jgi:hypothetical protein
MTTLKIKLTEALLVLLIPLNFCLIRAIDGVRPLITQFEAGAATAIVGLKLIEALKTYMKR